MAGVIFVTACFPVGLLEIAFRGSSCFALLVLFCLLSGTDHLYSSGASAAGVLLLQNATRPIRISADPGKMLSLVSQHYYE